MDSSVLQKLINDCPLLIRMNDGREFFVEKGEFIAVGDYTAGILVKDDDGVRRNAVISLMTITSVLPHAERPKRKPRRKSS